MDEIKNKIKTIIKNPNDLLFKSKKYYEERQKVPKVIKISYIGTKKNKK
jgi:hypothetical protein